MNKNNQQQQYIYVSTQVLKQVQEALEYTLPALESAWYNKSEAFKVQDARDSLKEALAQKPVQDVSAWKELFWKLALVLKCLPSTFPDANGHVISKVQRLMDAESTTPPAQQQEPVATVTSESGNPNVSMSWWHEPSLPVGTKLYTSPPAQQQESCGWRMRHNGVWAYSFTKDAWDFIYAVSPAARKAARDNAPASKPWVGLTEDEINACDPQEECWNLSEVARAIEANLREKNAAPRKPLTDEQILNLVPGLQDCLCDPWDCNNSGDYYASIPKDMIRLARAIEAAHGIKEKNNG